MSTKAVDLFVIGGGVNGCGIARDASGRGMTVTLAEMDDLAQATSSASTKLFHGGLRYLEYFEVRLVREALQERETLMKAMPHISWPMRFVLPMSPDMRFESKTPTSRLLSLVMPWMKGRRPDWLIRFGLLLYDHLGGRDILPGTATLDLATAPEGAPLKDGFTKAFEYSDAWVEDSRLVVLNARDAARRGATILTRTRVVSADRRGGLWTILSEDTETGKQSEHRARRLVNAAGPWVGQILSGVVRSNSADTVRLVRGSHIVTRRLFDHDKCYFFQGSDGRILFAIPYEEKFTLIGTTDQDHDDPDTPPVCTEAEQDYMIDFVNRYLRAPISKDDIVWTYSGVRPLYSDGAKSATAATRDYTLKLDHEDGAPLLNVFGGKITTYRRLAEAAMDKLQHVSIGVGDKWTARTPLPGGDFEVQGVKALISEIAYVYPFTHGYWARRLVRAYGTEVPRVLGKARSPEDLGIHFGATLTEREVVWLMDKEWARTAEDVVWRRSKLGLRMTPDQIAGLDAWMAARRAGAR